MRIPPTRRLRSVAAAITVMVGVMMVSSTALSRSWHSPHHHHGSLHGGVVVKGGDAAAIIATGIIVGVTFSLLDRAVSTSVPRCPQTPQPIYNVGSAVSHTAATGSVVVTAQMLNVRSGPGFGNPSVRQVPNGTVLSIQGNAPGWYYVKTSDNFYGWVMTQYTAPLG